MLLDFLPLVGELQYSMLLVKIGLSGMEAGAETEQKIFIVVGAAESEKKQSVG